MNDKLKDIVLVVLITVFIFGTFLINVLKKDELVSKSERRKLAQFPELSIQTVFKDKETFMSKFETYSLDQFTFRDVYRRIKALTTFYIFNESDNNQIYIAEGHASKYVEKLNESSVKLAAEKFNNLYKNYLSNMNVYYSIIPDKNYFLAEKNGYPSIDYDRLLEIMNTNINENVQYIDIFDSLSIDDYYKTDIHWRQEKLENVVKKLAESMNFKYVPIDKYTKNDLNGFYGVYYGQSALPIASETLNYLTNDIIDNVKVKVLNENTMKYEEKDGIYDLKDYAGMDPYDIYLYGSKPAIILENDEADTDRELIIFRDSFGSSLSPLLISSYKKITILDLRYIADLLFTDDIVEFKDGQDVLIMNYVDIFNNSSTIKVFSK